MASHEHSGTTDDRQAAETNTPMETSSNPPPSPQKPVSIIVIGMAGSGKTTLIQRLQSYLYQQKTPPYIINIDPAVTHMPYSPNIDIRDTVKYKNVMQQYNLGPNGGILTSCNLFATRFDQVIQLLEKPRDPPLQHILLDTPGQIEIFTWSASGQIITELLASSFPTVVAYVMDTPRCSSPQTFMSNMLQAVSILYKTQLPMILVFNKTDVVRHEFAVEWMSDFEAYHAALEKDTTYAATLSRSLSLVLDEFYKNMSAVGVSALTGEGMEEFFQAVQRGAQEYQEHYVPELEARKKEREAKEEKAKQKQMEALRKDLEASKINQEQQQGSSSSHTGTQQSGQQQSSSLQQQAAVGSSSSHSKQVLESSGGAALGALATGEDNHEDDDDDGCDYVLSDESIEDEEEEMARQEARAK